MLGVAPRDAHARPDGVEQSVEGARVRSARSAVAQPPRRGGPGCPKCCPVDARRTMADEPRRPTEEEMRAKLAEAAPKEGRETRAEADERRRQERRARRRARRQRNQPPPGPTPEEMKRNEIKAEADAILESWRSSFTAGLRAKESSDEELDEKTGKMRKLTVKERKRRRKLRAAAMRRAAAKARGGV